MCVAGGYELFAVPGVVLVSDNVLHELYQQPHIVAGKAEVFALLLNAVFDTGINDSLGVCTLLYY